MSREVPNLRPTCSSASTRRPGARSPPAWPEPPRRCSRATCCCRRSARDW